MAAQSALTLAIPNWPSLAQGRRRQWRHIDRGPAGRASERGIPRLSARSRWKQAGRGCPSGFLIIFRAEENRPFGAVLLNGYTRPTRTSSNAGAFRPLGRVRIYTSLTDAAIAAGLQRYADFVERH